MLKFVPRDYQIKAVASVHERLAECDSTLVVMPTGTGKTVVAGSICDDYVKAARRVMFIAHREELVEQAANSIRAMTGLDVRMEMANHSAEEHSMFKADVVVASVQTLTASKCRRLRQFEARGFGALIIDEAHHAVAKTYLKVIDWARERHVKVVGITATPDRGDETALGKVFDEPAFVYEILDAIKDGWLVPVDCEYVHVDGYDISTVKTVAGDLNQGQLAAELEREPIVCKMAASMVEDSQGRPTIGFFVTVKQAELGCHAVNGMEHGAARWVCGETPSFERRPIMQGFRAGAFRHLMNVGIACLDEQTEILTRSGWKGIDEISVEDEVANWDQGRMWFARPKALKVRPRRAGERMVVLEERCRSIRVTEDHRMLYRTATTAGRWSVKHAVDLVGKSLGLPVCGHAEPSAGSVVQDLPLESKKRSARLRASSYVHRCAGMDAASASATARVRLSRREGLRRADPASLTLDQCRWIGYWIGDGTRTPKDRGGIEYRISQGERDAGIIRWFESLCERCGYDFVRKNRMGVVNWSFCRGTGFGSQERRGIFDIEPYLRKDGSDLFWSLTTEQFDALVHGLWMADGNHGPGAESLPRVGAKIYSANRAILDLLQAIATCRGFRTQISRKKQSRGDQYVLFAMSISKRVHHRTAPGHNLQFESETWKPERVWCVVTDSSFLVSRRRGTVTIMGNTEGFDAPIAACCAMGRPTKSRALYAQCLGRITRPLPGIVDDPSLDSAGRRRAIAASGKPNGLVLDYVGNSGSHKLVTPADVLGGNYDDDVVEEAGKRLKAKKGGDPESIVEALEAAKAAKLVREQEKVRIASQRTRTKVDLFDALDIRVPCERGWHRSKHVTPRMRDLLERNGFRDIDKLSYVKASAICGAIVERIKARKASPKQVSTLLKAGMTPERASGMSFREASDAIGKISANGWRMPAGMLNQ